MLNSITSDKFQMSKLGSDMINVKVNGFGNTLYVPVNSIDELIDMLLRARDEFYPDHRNREYLRKLFK